MALEALGNVLTNNTANDFVSALTGQVGKAYVLFHKPVDTRGKNEKNEQSTLGEGETARMQRLAGKLMAKGNSPEAKGSRGVGANLFGMDTSLVAMAGQESYIPMRVQYNPSSIRFTGKAGLIRRDSPDNQGLSAVQTPAETNMHLELLFDATNVKDAFMLESLNVASVGALAQKGMQVAQAAQGKEYSVRDVTELFVAAVSFSQYRVVGFVWNKMIFWGEMTSVTVQYSMFSKAGNPIRAKVGLDLRQDMADGDGEYDTEKYWRDAYTEMFKTKYQTTATGSKNALQNIVQW